MGPERRAGSGLTSVDGDPSRVAGIATDSADHALARSLWMACETIHAVTYFHPTCLAAWRDAGCSGFWMGYFVGRFAPMGAVGGSAAEAIAFGFGPKLPRRALPAGWHAVPPDHALTVRASAAAAVLAEAGIDAAAAAALGAGLAELVASAAPGGRPMGAANQSVTVPSADPHAALWQACTTLRELRGDTHVAHWLAAGADGIVANVLTTAVHGHDPAALVAARGYLADEWHRAIDRARRLAWVDPAAGSAPDRLVATELGREVHRNVERATDAAAAAEYAQVADTDHVRRLVGEATEVAAQVVELDVLPYPNPMGLPRIGRGADG